MASPSASPPSPSSPSASSRGSNYPPGSMLHVGAGQGDYMLETKFKYVGQGASPDAAQEAAQQQRSASRAEASGSSCFTCAKSPSPRGGGAEGGGEYVQETAFKYVGNGAGEFKMVEDPKQRRLAASSGRQLNRIADFCSSPLNAVFAFLTLILLLAVIGLFWPSLAHARSIDAGIGAMSDDCVTRAIEVSLAGRQLPSTRVFHVTLDHSAWERFGFVLISERISLLVVGIDGGLLDRWNQAYPHHKVRKGDRVVKVNSVSGSTRAMLKEFSQAKEMHLLMLRAHCPDDRKWTSTSTVTTTTTVTAMHGNWGCYTWTSEEREMLHGWMVGEEQVCTRSREDGYLYRYAHSKSVDLPGCGEECWCCRQKRTDSKDPHVSQLLFRPGFQDYQGLVFNELRSKTPADVKADVVTVDSGDDGHRTQVLLRFDGIIGYGPSQIHPKSTIREAKLSLNVLNPGGGFKAHRMLKPWDATTTYEELGGDGATSGAEADAAPLDSAWHVMTGAVALDVTRAVQAWADGEQNYGIVLMPLSSDGIDFTTGTSANPPTLTVEAQRKVEQPDAENHETSTKKATTTALSTTTEPSTTTRESTTTPRKTTTSEAHLDIHGLHADFYYDVPDTATEWDAAVGDRQPDFEQTVPDASYSSGSSRWDGVRTDAPFAAEWSGTLILDVGGIYSFEVSSDDTMELAVDGDVLLGGASGDLGLSTLLPSHQVTSKDLDAGQHAISIKLLQLQPEGSIAIQCKYEGPDTDGRMVDLPEAALRPTAPTATELPHAGPEQKFGTGSAASASSRRPRFSGAAAATWVSLGLVFAFSPLLLLVVQHSRKVRSELAQRRSLCRYDNLANLVERGPSGRARARGHDGQGLA